MYYNNIHILLWSESAINKTSQSNNYSRKLIKIMDVVQNVLVIKGFELQVGSHGRMIHIVCCICNAISDRIYGKTANKIEC